MTRLKNITTALCFVIFCFIPLSAFAEMEIHPRFSLGEEYNDNIYLDDSNEEEDWITTVEPGIQFLYRGRSINAEVDYSMRFRFYKNNTDENQDEFKDVQRARASVLFFEGRPFTLNVSEIISRESLDERRNTTEYNELVDKSTVYHTTVNPQYDWQIDPTWSLVFGYVYDRFDYVDPRGDDYDENVGRVTLTKILSSRTDIHASYAYRIMNSDDPLDEYDRQDYLLGFVHQLGARTQISVEGGYSEVEYDSGFDTDSTLWNADISYDLTGALQLVLAYRQDYTVSATDGLRESKESSLAVNYEKNTVSARGETYWNKSDYVQLDRIDEAVGFRLNFANQFSSIFTWNLDGELEFAEYQDEGPDEEVERITLGTSLDYQYRRFLVTAGYRYRINDSDLENGDYTNNVVFLNGSIRF